MQRHVFPVLLMSAIGSVSVTAEPLSLTPTRYAQSNVRPAYVPPQPQPQTRCGTAIEREHTVCQRCYEQLDNDAFGKRVYLYVPDTDAVYHATGVRVRELPVKIEDLLSGAA